MDSIHATDLTDGCNTRLTEPLGLFGGTFDPVHHGHIALAEALLAHLSLSHIELMPCYQPVTGKIPKASAQDRVNMLKLAIADYPLLRINMHEIDQKAPIYTIDSLHALRAIYPQTPLCLMMGMDVFNHFESWHRYREILDCAHLLLIERAGTPPKLSEGLKNLLATHEIHDPTLLTTQQAGCLYRFRWSGIEVSSTQIRQAYQENQPPHALLPQSVQDYIQAHHLYVE